MCYSLVDGAFLQDSNVNFAVLGPCTRYVQASEDEKREYRPAPLGSRLTFKQTLLPNGQLDIAAYALDADDRTLLHLMLHLLHVSVQRLPVRWR